MHTPPEGWKVIYTGYAYGSHYTHKDSVGPICIDHENYDGSNPNSPEGGAHIHPSSVETTAVSEINTARYIKCVVSTKE
ncbi:MAG: hypothetical protein GY754_08270 [bacterium]|nr:hypothetical protein [bacterium]